MVQQFMETNTFLLGSKILNSQSHLEMLTSFILNKLLVQKMHKQVKSNTFKSG